MTNPHSQESHLSTHDSEKLYLPKFCLVPLRARLQKGLKDSAKIYLGELNVLTNQHGYCWASDQQLAEMKGVSVRTIQYWHSELEKYGLIKRVTWKEHVKHEDPNKRGLIVVTKRKIYVLEENSNNFDEPQKIAARSEPQKIAARSEPQKIAGINKEPLKEEKNNNPAPPAPSAVVVPSCLDKLEIPETLRKKITNEYSTEEIELATKRALNWKSRKSDEVAIMTALKKSDSWVDNASKEEISIENQKYLESLRHLDNKKLGPAKVIIGNKYIEFLCGMKCEFISTEDPHFKLKIKTYLEKLKRSLNQDFASTAKSSQDNKKLLSSEKIEFPD